jgi:type II secretory pathway component GspD/PulD (secretin)
MYKIFTALKCGELPCSAQKFILTMKLIMLILTLNLMQVHASSYGQQVSINVKNASVKEVLSQITKQTGYNFICDGNLIKPTNAITISMYNVDLKKVLDRCFTAHPVDIIYGADHTIIIKQKKQAPAIPSIQIINITGKVLDSRGQPLPGVSIKVKGTSTGTITDTNGAFALKVNDSKSILQFTFVGYVSQEVEVGNNTSFTITLAEQSQTLSDLVVVGYGKQSRATVTRLYYQG